MIPYIPIVRDTNARLTSGITEVNDIKLVVDGLPRLQLAAKDPGSGTDDRERLR